MAVCIGWLRPAVQVRTPLGDEVELSDHGVAVIQQDVFTHSFQPDWIASHLLAAAPAGSEDACALAHVSPDRFSSG